MVTHCVDLYDQLQLDVMLIITTTFDLWMNRCQQDTFALFVQIFYKFTIGLFEANDITCTRLARQLKAILKKFGFTFKVLCYVKDEGTNLVTMIVTLMSMNSYEALNLLQPFDGTCFGHVMNKVAQYATNDDRIYKNLALMSVKFVQTSLQSLHHLAKKIRYVDNFQFLQFKQFLVVKNTTKLISFCHCAL
jgi:hypothetical protein